MLNLTQFWGKLHFKFKDKDKDSGIVMQIARLSPITDAAGPFYSIELIFVNISSMDKRSLRFTELYEGFLS